MVAATRFEAEHLSVGGMLSVTVVRLRLLLVKSGWCPFSLVCLNVGKETQQWSSRSSVLCWCSVRVLRVWSWGSVLRSGLEGKSKSSSLNDTVCRWTVWRQVALMWCVMLSRGCREGFLKVGVCFEGYPNLWKMRAQRLKLSILAIFLIRF